MLRNMLISLVILLVLADWAIADTIVYLGDTAPLPAQDAALVAIFEELGFDIEEHADEEKQPVDTAGAVLVFISRSVSSVNVLGAYNKHSIPVVVAESHMWDDMHFATDGTFIENNTQDIIIVDEDHPIAGDLKGKVEVTSNIALFMSSSDWKGDAQIVATVPKDTGAIVCYEKGATLGDGSKAPARRVCLFTSRDTFPILTDEGRGIMERTVLWALGRLEQPVNPEGTLAVTWGAIKIPDHR